MLPRERTIGDELALDVLNDYIEGRICRRLFGTEIRHALKTTARLEDPREHETKLLWLAGERVVTDAEQESWERLGGAGDEKRGNHGGRIPGGDATSRRVADGVG